MMEFPNSDPAPKDGWFWISPYLRRQADMCVIEQNKFWDDIRLILSRNGREQRRELLTAYSAFKRTLYLKQFDAIIRSQSLRNCRPLIRRILAGLKVSEPF